MSVRRYDVGDLVRVEVTFRDINDVLIDPTAIQARALRPDGTQLPIEVFPAGNVVQDSLGVFHLDVLPDTGSLALPWVVKFSGTGPVVAAVEHEFWVDVPRVTFV